MKAARLFSAAAATLALSACSGMKITHVPPGKSAYAALLAQQAPQEQPAPAGGEMPAAAGSPVAAQLPPGELPPLPSGGAAGQHNPPAPGVAETFQRGTFAMQTGQNTEAIAAFEEAVKQDPEYTDAWGMLAILYQREGQTAKATDAFKKAKRLGDANGGTVSRDELAPLQFP